MFFLFSPQSRNISISLCKLYWSNCGFPLMTTNGSMGSIEPRGSSVSDSWWDLKGFSTNPHAIIGWPMTLSLTTREYCRPDPSLQTGRETSWAEWEEGSTWTQLQLHDLPLGSVAYFRHLRSWNQHMLEKWQWCWIDCQKLWQFG